MNKYYIPKNTDDLKEAEKKLVKDIISFWRSNYKEYQQQEPSDIENYFTYSFNKNTYKIEKID